MKRHSHPRPSGVRATGLRFARLTPWTLLVLLAGAGILSVPKPTTAADDKGKADSMPF